MNSQHAFSFARLPNAPNAQTLCLRLAPSQPTHLQSHDAAQSEGRSPFVCCPNVARDLPRKHDCSRNVKSSLAFARVYLRTARRHSVTSEEVLSVLAAPDEYELERGVWYLLEAPSTLAVSHSACVLSARFGLSDDDLFNLLQPAAIPDFQIAKESTRVQARSLQKGRAYCGRFQARAGGAENRVLRPTEVHAI